MKRRSDTKAFNGGGAVKKQALNTNTATATNGKTTKKTVKKNGKITSSTAAEPPVDEYCKSIPAGSRVFRDDFDPLPSHPYYNAMLNQTNLQHNNNKFYLLQLIQHPTLPSTHYSVWFRWGRVGQPGQTKLTSCGSDLDKAKKLFEDKFSSKTCNFWEARDMFEKVDGKYDLVVVDYSVQDDPDDKSNGQALVEVESKLPERVQALIKMLFNLAEMERAMQAMNYDAKRAPLGKLTQTQISLGYTALNQISSLVTKLDNADKASATNGKRRTNNKSGGGESKASLEKQLLAACNQFYTRIPHNFGMRVPPMIKSPEEVKQKLDLLEALEDILFAVNAVEGGAKKQEQKRNKLDLQYDQLKCNLDPISASDPVYQLVETYLTSNHGHTHSYYKLELVDLYECYKSNEKASFVNHGNRMLLWHGSRLTNFAGILGRGLRIAPPEAPVTGYMFGKGVYFADSSSKSANYTHVDRRNPIGLMVLCEVSLGTTNNLYASCYEANKLPTGKHSTKGLGRVEPDRSTWKTLDDGTIVPIGKLGKPCSDDIDAEKCYLQFNEYIVYDERQIRLRYLVKVKFNFDF